MRGDQDYTHEMAEQLLAIAAQPLPEPDAEQVKRLVLDYLGVSLRGAGTPWTESLIQWAERYQGTGSATVANSPLRVAPHVAALVNGTAAHGYELDDTHDPSMSHPGAVVISAALAVASETRSSGAQFLSAVAAGYQAMGRLGMAANAGRVMERGFHPTALFGPFGAAVAAVALHGLDAATLAGAWGHALSLTGGSMQFSDEPEGTTVKRLHAGYAASHGVMAAELAKASIGAPVRSLDGKHGFLSMFGSEPNPSRLLREEGERLEIHRISMKPYSCCRLFHSLIDALQEATNDFSTDLENIEGIHIRAPAAAVDYHMLARPTSVMAAQYSLPFVMGATLVHGPYRYDAYHESRLSDSRVLALADRVQATSDAHFEAFFPEHFGGRVRLQLRDGEVRESEVLDSLGTPARPMSIDALRRKLRTLTAEVCPEFDETVAADAVWCLNEHNDTGALEQQLVASR